MNKWIFRLTITSVIVFAGCSTNQEHVTSQPGWQAIDESAPEKQRKEENNEVDLRSIF